LKRDAWPPSPEDILRELRGNFVSELLHTSSGRRRLKRLMPHQVVDESIITGPPMLRTIGAACDRR
jgi:hypothetical protein